ncbi:hypothetical protein [Myxococcus sp. SDU36]|uniref:tetratricopeptide repeat protein n=1 Tax=Myxococcus sp. SDU36 TaxID=2831967 RepID=UPI0025438214|nr:hypothetical protein [Myxococcus sp. SDU36]WIG97220.1 hypothetical protein KGD87_07475 [Myxococcus sp. SDU36]
MFWGALIALVAVGTATLLTRYESLWSAVFDGHSNSRLAGGALFWLLLAGLFTSLVLIAGRLLSRRWFHFALICLALSIIVGVALYEESSLAAKEEFPCSPADEACVRSFLEARLSVAPHLANGNSPSTHDDLNHEVGDQPSTSLGASSSLLHGPGGSGELSDTQESDANPWTMWLIFAAFSLVIYHWGRLVHSSRATLPIEVGEIVEEGVTEKRLENPTQKAPDSALDRRNAALELLFRQTLQKNAPHSTSRIPGGSLLYWRDLLESQTNDRLGFFTQSISLLMRIAVPLHGLRVSGIVVSRGTSQNQEEGLRFTVKNLRTHRVELADTYWYSKNAGGIDRAVMRAAYATSSLSLDLCPTLPRWTYWSDRDGEIAMDYWEGVEAFSAVPFHVERINNKRLIEACNLFKSAAKKSHGNALAQLQYGQAHEARGHYAHAAKIYLDLSERYPHMILARLRLALVCSYVDRWIGSHQKKRMPVKNTNLASDLSILIDSLRSSHAFEHFNRTSKHIQNEEQWSSIENWFSPDGTLDAHRSRGWFHLFSLYLIGELKIDCGARVLWWCASDTSERRRFTRTLLWPPSLLRAMRTSIKALQCCVALRDCMLYEPKKTKELLLAMEKQESRSWPWEKYKLHRGHKGDTRDWLQRAHSCIEQARTLSCEANSTHRKNPSHWGTAHYNLACFYALCMTMEMEPFEEFSGTARASNPIWHFHRIREPERHCDAWAKRALHHLSQAMRDPSGPIAQGKWWWLTRDPDLRALRRHPYFKDWKHWVELEYHKND